MSFEAYKVAIQLSLVNGVTTGLVAITGQFNTLNKTITSTRQNVSDLEKQLATLKRNTMIGGAMVAAGGFGLGLLGGPVEAAKEYELAYTRFKTLNLGDAVNQQADKFARSAQTFGTSSRDMMEALRLSVGIFGKDELGIAYEVAPKLAALNAANATLFGGKVDSIDEGATRSINRFIDMRGLAGSKEGYMHGLDLAQKIVTGSGGTIQFRDLEQFAKRGGTAFKGLSDDGLFNMMLAMQEMGGSTSGTALMSAYQNLVAGRTTKKTMAALQELGLAKLGMVSHGKVGDKDYSTVQITDMVDAEMLRTNFMGWMAKNVLPKIADKSLPEQAAIVNNLLSNRTGSNLGVTAVTQLIQMMRDANLGKNAMGADATINAVKGTAAGGIAEFHARMTDLKVELGQGLLPILIKLAQKATECAKALKWFSDTFPNLTKGIMITFGVLSGMVAVGGVLTLTKTAFKAIGLALDFLPSLTGPTGLITGFRALSGILAPLVGPMAAFAGAILSVGTAVYAAYKFIKGEDASNWISRLADKGVSFLAGRETSLGSLAYDAFGGDSHINSIATGKGKQQPIVVQSILDGKLVGQSVTNYVTKAASRPQTGGTAFDPTHMSPLQWGAR